MTGKVLHASGDPFPGIAIGVWAETWVGTVSQSEADGKFELSLTGLPPGTFKVAAVRWDTCSEQEGRRTAVNCRLESNVVEIVTTANCTGAGASQVTEMNFVGP